MQKYLKPNETKITQEEAREIFRMRCNVSDVKANYRWKFEDVDCSICQEEENQEHIINCNMINNYEMEEIPQYDEIWKSDVKNQIQIAKKLIENMNIRKKILKLYLDL